MNVALISIKIGGLQEAFTLTAVVRRFLALQSDVVHDYIGTFEGLPSNED